MPFGVMIPGIAAMLGQQQQQNFNSYDPYMQHLGSQQHMQMQAQYQPLNVRVPQSYYVDDYPHPEPKPTRRKFLVIISQDFK